MKDLFSHLEDSIESLELVLQNGNLSDSKFRKVWDCIQVLKCLEEDAPKTEKVHLSRREKRILERLMKGTRVRFKKNRERRLFEMESLVEKGLIFDLNPANPETMVCGITEKGRNVFRAD